MAVDSVPRLYLICRDFRPTEQISDSWYATQALADAAAVASGADFTAHQGAVAVPQNWMSGWIYNATSDTWRTQDLRDLDDLGKRKHAARGLQLALVAIQSAARLMASFRPRRDVQRVATITAMARWANYVVFQNVHDTWTSAQQIAWAGAMAEGATDATDAQALYQRAHVLRADAVPAEAFAWASPADAARVDLADGRAQSAVWFDGEETDLTMVELGNGAWIENIT